MTIPDMPDNYPYLPQSTRFPLADMGELAARLGSMVTYDRRGEVIWMDDFGSGTSGWGHAGYGTGSGVKIVASPTGMGSYAMRLQAGSDGDMQAQLFRFFSPAYLGRAGVEAMLSFETDFDSFGLWLARFDGSEEHRGNIYLSMTGEQIEYVPKGTGRTRLGPLPDLVSGYGLYHNVKLVVDFGSDEYVRFLIDDQEYDMSGIPLWVADASDIPQHRINLVLYGRSGNNDVCYVDRVIITGNEP